MGWFSARADGRGLDDAGGPAEAEGSAEAEGLTAEAVGLAEAAEMAEAGWVAEAERLFMVAELVSTSSPADAPTAPLQGLGRQSWLYGAQRRPSNGERETTTPEGWAPPHPLTP